MQLCKITGIAFICSVLCLFGSAAAAHDFFQLAGVVHIHSTYSSGRYGIEALAAMAAKKNIGVLILTDNDQVVMEYGLPPFRHLIKRRAERRSVLQVGPETYLSEIERLNAQQQTVLIIPGVQSSPFYYWAGNPFKAGLTAYNYRKELLLIGLPAPDDYYKLPQPHGGLSTRNWRNLLPRFIIFLAVFLLSVYLTLQNGKTKICGILIACLSAALMVNHHPFKSSSYDAYHGDQGSEPFQQVIDYTRRRGGLVFWAHPESNYAKNGVQLGPIKMKTGHYADELIQTTNYTGFAAIYGDSSTAANAGMHWDQILSAYCKGQRDQPVWAIAGSDFHQEQKGFELDTFQTIFLVKDKRSQDVLQALERGRIYAVKKSKDSRLSLDHFNVMDKRSGNAAIMGEEINVKGTPVLEGRISALDNGRQNVKISIIRDGKPTWTFDGQTPLDFHLLDRDEWSGKKYYRLDVKSQTGGYLLSNPIFVVRNIN